MSYARLGPTSDVYVFASDLGLHCHGCALGLEDSEALGTCQMLRHLRRHRAAGDKVPESAMLAIRDDAIANLVVRVVARINRLLERAT